LKEIAFGRRFLLTGNVLVPLSPLILSALSLTAAFSVDAAAVASQGEHARRVLASAGPADDVLAA
jgi:hypothetical protein